MQFASDPAVNSFVKVKRQGEPIWLQVTKVNAGQGTLVAQVLVTPMALGAEVGDPVNVTFQEVLDTLPATATPVHATATLPVKPRNAEKQQIGKF